MPCCRAARPKPDVTGRTRTLSLVYSFLLLCCLAAMTLIFRERCLRAGRIHINPIFGLLVGVGYYVLLPCTVIAYFGRDLGDVTVYDHYLTLPNAVNVMALTLALLVAVWTGLRLPAVLRRAARGGGGKRSRVWRTMSSADPIRPPAGRWPSG